MELIDNKYVQGALGAIVGSIGTIFVFRKRLADIEKDHYEFRKETLLMFKEIRQDVKILIGRRHGDNDFTNNQD